MSVSSTAQLVLLLGVAGCGSRAAPAEPAPVVDTERWVTLSPGSFSAGAPRTEFCRRDEPEPQEIKISSGFEIAPYEVTQAQFEARMGYDPSFSSHCPTCPVDSVSWHEAAAYALALSTAQGLGACYECLGQHEDVRCEVVARCDGIRLPTEAEWEYAARAGTETSTYAGRITSCMSKDEVAEQVAWYKANSGGATHPVGSKISNPWGLADMLGNVYEWAHEPTADGRHVLRGGSWYHNAERSRAASRLVVAGDGHLSYAGFRLVKPLAAPAAD